MIRIVKTTNNSRVVYGKEIDLDDEMEVEDIKTFLAEGEMVILLDNEDEIERFHIKDVEIVS